MASCLKLNVEGYLWKDDDSYDIQECKAYGNRGVHRLQGYFYKVYEDGTKVKCDIPLAFWRHYSTSLLDYSVNENKRATFWIAYCGEYPDFN